jgi:phosphoserine phosphatase RsbU/P
VEEDPIIAVSRISAVPAILRVITEVTGLRLSLIAHVTEDEWTCCAVSDQLGFGLQVGGHLDIATTLCSDVRQSQAPIIINHASVDPTYCEHKTPKLYAFESYISVPIWLRSGEYFGNVCALDSRPTVLTEPKTLAMFQLFSELVGLQIDAEARHEATSRALLDARATAELREQFIAVLGHDLRTPLHAIALGTELLATSGLPAKDMSVVRRIGRSVGRITRLIEDVLDFARGRLGAGIPLDAAPIADVVGLLRHVIDELQAAHPERPIEVRVDGAAPVHGDPVRLSQLLQNLLGNALVHSPPTAHVKVAIHIDDSYLVLSVSNGGPALPASLMARMFEPYKRGTSARPGGLGLGLYIAAQIVRSHRGSIEVESTDVATTITCRLPRSPGQALT